MRKIRIGKSLAIAWPILTNGERKELAGRDLTLSMTTPEGNEVELEIERTEGHILYAHVAPDVQTIVGVYRLTLTENAGSADTQSKVDHVGAFRLTETTATEDPGNSEDIAAAEVLLGSGWLAVGTQSKAAEINGANSVSIEGGQDTEVVTVTQGEQTTIFITAKPGKDGESGPIGPAGPQGPQGERGTGLHRGEFNAGLITEEGWYDSITLGRPEGSESDEKYVLYQSSYGGQICFSRRNSGKAFSRLSKEHPWVSLNHDDYATQQSAAAALIHYGKVNGYIGFNEWVANVSAGFGTDSNTRLAEVYAGNGCENKVIDVYTAVFLRPNDIIKVRAIYRRGFSWEGVDNYPYDSDAYIYVSDQTAAGHELTHLKSDFVKVKSLGSLGFPFTEEQKQWQDLAFVRDVLFRSDTEYGWHYIKVNVPVAGNYYLHIAGNFSSNASWIVFGDGQVLTGAEAYQKPTGGIPKSDLTSTVQDSLNKADSALQEHQPLFPSDPQDSADANELSVTGFRGYVNVNIPSDAAGWGSMSIRRATTPDGNGFISVEQTFYGRSNGDTGKIWQRLGFIDAQGTLNFMGWVLIGSNVQS